MIVEMRDRKKEEVDDEKSTMKVDDVRREDSVSSYRVTKHRETKIVFMIVPYEINVCSMYHPLDEAYNSNLPRQEVSGPSHLNFCFETFSTRVTQRVCEKNSLRFSCAARTS